MLSMPTQVSSTQVTPSLPQPVREDRRLAARWAVFLAFSLSFANSNAQTINLAEDRYTAREPRAAVVDRIERKFSLTQVFRDEAHPNGSTEILQITTKNKKRIVGSMLFRGGRLASMMVRARECAGGDPPNCLMDSYIHQLLQLQKSSDGYSKNASVTTHLGSVAQITNYASKLDISHSITFSDGKSIEVRYDSTPDVKFLSGSVYVGFKI
jgi:hypothetical protein